MNIQNINNDIFCEPTDISHIEEIKKIFEMKIEGVYVSFKKLDDIEKNKNYHSIKGMLVGCLSEMEKKYQKNVIVITNEKIFGGILNYIVHK